MMLQAPMSFKKPLRVKLSFIHPGHKQVTNNLTKFLMFTKRWGDLYARFPGIHLQTEFSFILSVLLYLYSRFTIFLSTVQFYIHYSHHIDERTWNASFFTYFSTTRGNKFSVS